MNEIGAETQEIKIKDKFYRVKDSRGRLVPNLYERNGRFYTQYKAPGRKNPRRYPLLDANNEPVQTVPQAITAQKLFDVNKEKGKLPGPRITPAIGDYYQHYCNFLDQTQAKDDKTIDKERSHLKQLAISFGASKTEEGIFTGGLRLNAITRKNINEHVLRRKKEGMSNRTVNLDILALSNLLNFAKDEGLVLHDLPTVGWKPLDWTPPKRELREEEQIVALCDEASKKNEDGSPKYENGEKLVDYLWLMARSGARRTAALEARWDAVNWDTNQITFHTKYEKDVTVDFNEPLEVLLKAMWEKRTSDEFLFPSSLDPKRVTKSIRKTFELVRKAAGLPEFNYHDLRHFFISWCVMSGIDFMTIARWVGHADGGVLIGKVYGHLCNEHTRKAAEKVSFSVKPGPSSAPTESQPGVVTPLPTTAPDISKLTVQELLALVQQKVAEGEKQAA